MKKKYKAVISDELTDKMKQMPKKDQTAIYEAIEKLLKNPYDGHPVIREEMNITIICKKCKSSNTESWKDIGDPKEHLIIFDCHDCGESFWWTMEDYEESKKAKPDYFIKKETYE